MGDFNRSHDATGWQAEPPRRANRFRRRDSDSSSIWSTKRKLDKKIRYLRYMN